MFVKILSVILYPKVWIENRWGKNNDNSPHEKGTEITKESTDSEKIIDIKSARLFNRKS